MHARDPARALCTLAAVATLWVGAVDVLALPAEYFPADLATPADETGWRELAESHPHRVRLESGADVEVAALPETLRVEVRPDLDYVRVRDLARDLPVVESALSRRGLVLDLRFVFAELDASVRLGHLLCRSSITLPAPGLADNVPTILSPAGRRGPDQRTVVLVNRQTRGPLEAVLAALQQSGSVLLVGTATAGDTGFFRPVDGYSKVTLIAGEHVATHGASLLDRGATPGLLVDCDATADATAYQALDAGTPLAALLDPPVRKPRVDESTLLRRHSGDPTGSPHPANELGETSSNRPAEPGLGDRILQRGINVLIALDSLTRAS